MSRATIGAAYSPQFAEAVVRVVRSHLGSRRVGSVPRARQHDLDARCARELRVAACFVGARRQARPAHDRRPGALKATSTRCLGRGFGWSELSGATVVRKRGRRAAPKVKDQPACKKRKIDLIAMSVAPQTFRHYEAECVEFEAWAPRHRRLVSSHERADEAMREYFEELAMEREAPQIGALACSGFCS